ncbi:alpha/beta hydrolase [Cellulomonas phragmiteti]|uniref:Peptidase n=1 Tax=Cellulomonas phragmiteti TaxID=478780 RepID=A0ABQ4DHW5_9CELL|nr:alpha/beta hydrolase [Cellulomonas phragmiteti]GIG38943.1 peptidase [Cellulomonas phragmiteti]
MRRPPTRHAVAATAVAACLALTVTTLTSAGAAAHGRGPGHPGHPGHDRTSRVEAARVDRVPTPDPRWTDCSQAAGTTAECGTVDLPLDYDQPRRGTTRIALLRVPATDPQARIGTLFLNPGGPSGSGVDMAVDAHAFLSPEVLARFDVVGFDPRGVGYSAQVRCFADMSAQTQALAGMFVAFPTTEQETTGFLASAHALGRGCSTTGAPLSASMSTAQVARDLDVLRRAVGDERLSYLGFSYGSVLGQVYANLFPDRNRVLAIDGVIDPWAWAGTRRTAGTPVTDRIGSGAAGWRSMLEVLDRCGAAGPDVCRTAGLGAPRDVWAQVTDALRVAPVGLPDPDSGAPLGELAYADVVALVLGELYSPVGAQRVDTVVWAVHHLQLPDTPENAELRQQAARELLALFDVPLEDLVEAERRFVALSEVFGRDTTYANGFEAFSGVVCADALGPRRGEAWIGAAQASEAAAPGFGPRWTWLSTQCATRSWTAQDEDAYRGPFDARTVAPVLVVGNLWDPATPYEGAQAAARELPHSRLLSSDSWGHVAYGTSACVTGAVDRYLLSGELPAEGATCVGDAQPFVEQPQTRSAQEPRSLPPVVPPVPGATPRTS